MTGRRGTDCSTPTCRCPGRASRHGKAMEENPRWEENQPLSHTLS